MYMNRLLPFSVSETSKSNPFTEAPDGDLFYKCSPCYRNRFMNSEIPIAKFMTLLDLSDKKKNSLYEENIFDTVAD